MKFHIVIPARYASTRLPAKPLQNILGEPLLAHVYRRAQQAQAQSIVIATDHPLIRETAEAFGAQVCMTNSAHQSGTDRLAEVAEQLCLSDNEVVVNVQGDVPCMHGMLIRQVGELLADPEVVMGTLAKPLHDQASIQNSNVVKVVLDRNNNALYFSRSVIPYDRDATGAPFPYLKHIGVYAYRAGFLRQFVRWPQAPMEVMERLEQLRALWQGTRIKVTITEEELGPEVDTPEDLLAAEAWLRQHGVG